MPGPGTYEEVFNSDDKEFNGSGVIRNAAQKAEKTEWNGRPYSVMIGVPPLACVILKRKDTADAK
ncbi:MAG: alpha amylase C-terminal domain-containing protein [Candidatus Marinimicrobia bacterium]|nr:alpha amylase C-terminal domain-containing protein [Candidatus Neomarinimicrobiota bacterium]